MLDTSYGDLVDWTVLISPFFEFDPGVKWWYLWQITNEWQSYNSVSLVDIGMWPRLRDEIGCICVRL